MNFMKTSAKGILLALLVALVSYGLTNLLDLNFLSPGVFALLLGMVLNPYLKNPASFSSGLTFTSKKILKFAIILMGLGLSFTQIFAVGKFSLVVMVFTLTAAFLGGYLLGKLLKMPWKLTSLISAGTGICGGSAIAAIAPVIEAKDEHVAYGISATFIFDVLMVVLFPLMGRALLLSDLGFGLWTGTAVNDTSSVVAAAYAFSDAAGQFAVIVKLTRTLSIVPVVLIFSFLHERMERKTLEGTSSGSLGRKKVDLRKIFPFFILFFLFMVALKSTGWVPASLTESLTSLSKFLMVMSLGSIGLKTSFKKMRQAGLKPLLHGFLISTLVVVVSLLVQQFLGQI